MANGPEEFFSKKKAEAEARRPESQQYVRTRMAELRDRAVSKAFAREPEPGEQVVEGAGGYTYYFNPETQSIYIAEAPGGKGVGTMMDSSTRNQSAYKAILAEIGPEVAPLVGPGGLVPTLPHLRRGDNNRRDDTVFGGPMRAMRGAAQTMEEEFPRPPGGQRATYDRASAAGRQMRGELGQTLGSMPGELAGTFDELVDTLTPDRLQELGDAVARRRASEPGPKY